ncbi:serine/threonine-protein kinase [Planctomycetaceae bacterium SH139]
MNDATRNIHCDLARADAFLESNDYRLEDPEFVAHLDTCESCRAYLDANAAELETWNEAGELLRPGEFDAAGTKSFSAAAMLIGGIDQQPVAIQSVLDQLAPTDDPHRLGRLGNYEISGVIGVGGMGVVLKAHDPSLERVVAVKVMAPGLANNEQAKQRFAREAKAAAAVLHPNVVPIYSVSSDDDIPHLVMAYVRGGSLQTRLDKDGPPPLVEVLRIGSQIAAGLAAAHEQGLVHRDIKPENILLEDGVERVTITDFGLARAVDDNTLTQLGSIAGTPQYMSPEQARGDQIDQRTDLFSLGSVLYALCTGRPPFQDQTSYGVMRRIIDEEPIPIRQLNPEVPVWLASLVERLMAKEQSDRFASSKQVHELLEGCLRHLQHPSVNPIPLGLQKSRWTLLKENKMKVIIGAGVLAMGIFGVLFVQQATRPYSPTNFGAFFNLHNDRIAELPVAEEPTLTSGRVTIGDRQRILGSWQVVDVPLHWNVKGESEHEGWWYTFQEDQFTASGMQGGTVPSSGEWKIDEKSSPRRISLDVDGQETKALYTIQNEYLSIFFRRGAGDYPASFPTPVSFTESGTLLVLQRTEYPTVDFPYSDPTPGEARLLSSYKNNLTLPQLTSLNSETATMFSQHRGILSLPSVRELTPEAARALAVRDGVSLHLRGLKSMTSEVAKELAKARCGLTLGLETITPEVAASLAPLSTSLDLNHLHSISPEVARLLTSNNRWLKLNGLRTLDADVAEALAGHPGWLSLNGIESITPEAAEALGQFRGTDLALNRLQTLDIEVAEHLAQAQPTNSLSFNSVKTLSPEVAAALVAGNHRHLSLQGLETLPDESLKILRRHERRKIEANTGGMLLPAKFDLQNTYASLLLSRDKQLAPNPNVAWPYKLEEIDGNATLVTDKLTVVFEGEEYSNRSSGSLTISGSSGPLRVRSGELDHQYSNGACTVKFRTHVLKILDGGNLLSIQDNEVDLSQTQQVVTVKKGGGIIAKDR